MPEVPAAAAREAAVSRPLPAARTTTPARPCGRTRPRLGSAVAAIAVPKAAHRAAADPDRHDLPLATLLGQAERPGEGHNLGTLDPALTRALAATATLSPHTTLCITVTDPDGIAIGHGCAKTSRSGRPARPPDGPSPPLIALRPGSTSPSPPPA